VPLLSQKNGVGVFRKNQRIDVQTSKAHLSLLTHFRNPRLVSDFSEDKWRPALGESVEQAMMRLYSDGMLVQADLLGRLSYKYTVGELKVLLKSKNLPVSGRKSDLINRLIQNDASAAEKHVLGLIVFQWSEKGRAVAEKFDQAEEEEFNRVEQAIFDHLTNLRFSTACQVMALYRKNQLFPPSIGYDWSKYRPDEDEKILNLIFRGHPKICKRVNPRIMPEQRIAAGITHLLNESDPKKWLEADSETGLNFDSVTAARMLKFFAVNQIEISNYKKRNVVCAVEVLAARDSCEACKKLNGQRFALNQALELPYEHCDHNLGCRCGYLPIVKGMEAYRRE
jgi:hypothetical protein